jgi:hypothetical protein
MEQTSRTCFRTSRRPLDALVATCTKPSYFADFVKFPAPASWLAKPLLRTTRNGAQPDNTMLEFVPPSAQVLRPQARSTELTALPMISFIP